MTTRLEKLEKKRNLAFALTVFSFLFMAALAVIGIFFLEHVNNGIWLFGCIFHAIVAALFLHKLCFFNRAIDELEDIEDFSRNMAKIGQNALSTDEKETEEK